MANPELTHRERFLRTMRFQAVDRAPYWVASPWATTLDRWRSEGLPANTDLRALFGADPVLHVGIYYGMAPAFEREVIAEDEQTRTVRNHEGIILRELKDHTETSMPQFLRFPVETRDDYRQLKWRLQLNEEHRFPSDWPQRAASWQDRIAPLHLFADREGGFFGPLRNLMGLERLAMAFYDEPALIEEMIEDRAELVIAVTRRILQDTTVDYFCFWEDMAYKGGSLLSPSLFRKYCVPAYRRVCEFLRSHGVDVIFVDSDGDIHELIPLWLEAGLNGVLPLEAQSGMDPVKLRKQYGRELLMIGGIDKRALAHGPEAIRSEVMSKVPRLIEQGGYIPSTDHSLPPDVSFANFRYYMETLAEVLGV